MHNDNTPPQIRDRISFLGIEIDRVDLKTAVDCIVSAAQRKEKGIVVTPNVDHIVMLKNDTIFCNIYMNAQFIFADGMPLVWLSRLLHDNPLPERVTGADLLPAVCGAAAERGLRVYFMGGNPGVAQMAADKIAQIYPSFQVAGVCSPPFGFEHDEQMSQTIVNEINTLDIDILFIGVGAPKQEKWASKYLTDLNVGPILGVGAAFDFAAGTVKRAPVCMQKLGLEWLWRLLREPRRLWRRYVLQDSKFLVLAFREALNNKRNTPNQHN